ncbi:MAG: cytochrome c biogenesis protein CcsA [Chthoniobacterales bacterium]
MERYWLIAATLCFLFSFAYTLYAVATGKFRSARINLLAMAAGFAAQTTFLYMRGQQDRSCPINTLFEVIIFLSWSIVLIYLLIGPAYHLSLMGAFTAPLVFFLNVIALVSPLNQNPHPKVLLNPWLEMHVALSLMAYGGFGLACIAGVMYLVQERQLKSGRPDTIFYHLPPISDLNVANGRLLRIGFVLLTLGLAAGFFLKLPVANAKFAVSLGIWAIYGIILLLRKTHSLAPRRMAALSIIVFILALVTLPAIQMLSVAVKR